METRRGERAIKPFTCSHSLGTLIEWKLGLDYIRLSEYRKFPLAGDII
ncbi:hypothetical protein [Cylindrospermopsis raciborskii]|nr:hypothetical protein [Cylindrospermopsis raciborskii]MCZ2207987.1 hypothetical protein [Cylindrospermopsis raciborskii PAMP2011]